MAMLAGVTLSRWWARAGDDGRAGEPGAAAGSIGVIVRLADPPVMGWVRQSFSSRPGREGG
jgi:hypothetical protein